MLRRYTWKRAKSECQHYRRRTPETSELYRVVYHSRHQLEYVWEERFQSQYGVLRQEVLTVLDEYLNCGLLEHGAARVYCESCKHSLLVAFSCKKRGVCPSCSAKRAVNFAEHLCTEVLEEVPHRHVVFSPPKRLRPYFRYDRKLCDILFRAAWQSIDECLGADDKRLALVLTLQTAGEALNFHPHLHGVLADGRFGSDGAFEPFSEVDLKAVNDCFGELVLSEFAKRELITDDVMSQILAQEHTGFSVWCGDPFDDSDSKRFVARYVERGPLSLEKLSVQDDIVTYTTKDGTAHEFDTLEFLALLSSHIPKTYESLTRYYGQYSCRVRGELKKKTQPPNQETDTLPEPLQRPSLAWARSIKQVYEVNPLECPKCHSEMRVIAFVNDPLEVQKIMKALGLPLFRAPPPIAKNQQYDLHMAA